MGPEWKPAKRTSAHKHPIKLPAYPGNNTPNESENRATVCEPPRGTQRDHIEKKNQVESVHYEHEAEAGAADREQLGLFVLFDGEDEGDPEGEGGGVARHLAVLGGEALDDPGGGATLEAIEKGFACLHEFLVGGLACRAVGRR
ncbi:hypothetical protein CVT26_014580 [Gymnopilus dilepis]|uniref:Uncharacterized protein n=1 Tax=Gymnopilus dilepis TaxID=231916 RepID=A0A409W328_9AGAR|nr:hypothetical protein CVT26_014580 [Gymnopilus dilepis]